MQIQDLSRRRGALRFAASSRCGDVSGNETGCDQVRGRHDADRNIDRRSTPPRPAASPAGRPKGGGRGMAGHPCDGDAAASPTWRRADGAVRQRSANVADEPVPAQIRCSRRSRARPAPGARSRRGRACWPAAIGGVVGWPSGVAHPRRRRSGRGVHARRRSAPISSTSREVRHPIEVKAARRIT